jgi:hypothetical protein
LTNHFLKQSDFIGHDAVYAKIEQVIHLSRVIDSPYMNLQSSCMSSVNEALRDDAQRPLSYGHLCSERYGRTSKTGSPTNPRAESNLCDIAGPHTCADSWTKLFANGVEPCITERSNADALEHVSATQTFEQVGQCVVAFAIDVEFCVWPCAEQLIEPWDGLTT